jgi:hypothetical protein
MFLNEQQVTSRADTVVVSNAASVNRIHKLKVIAEYLY